MYLEPRMQIGDLVYDRSEIINERIGYSIRGGWQWGPCHDYPSLLEALEQAHLIALFNIAEYTRELPEDIKRVVDDLNRVHRVVTGERLSEYGKRFVISLDDGQWFIERRLFSRHGTILEMTHDYWEKDSPVITRRRFTGTRDDCVKKFQGKTTKEILQGYIDGSIT